jgi:HEAT repeat protein
MKYKIISLIALLLPIILYDNSYAIKVDKYYDLPESVKTITDITALEPYLNSENSQFRLWGIIRLGQIGSEDNINRLLDYYDKEKPQIEYGVDGPTPLIKYFALKAIGDIGGHSAESVAVNIAEHFHSIGTPESLQIFSCLCDVLGKIGTPNTLDRLQIFYNNHDFDWLSRKYALRNIILIDLKNARFKTAADTTNYLIDFAKSNFSDDCRNRENFIITNAVSDVFYNINSQKIIGELSLAIDSMSDATVYKQHFVIIKEGMLLLLHK